MDILFSPKKNTLQGTNISPTKALVNIIVLFPRWDMLVSQRVIWNHQNGRYLGITFDFERLDASQRLLLGKDGPQFQPYWEKPGQVGGQNFATNPTKTNTPPKKQSGTCMHMTPEEKISDNYFWILEHRSSSCSCWIFRLIHWWFVGPDGAPNHPPQPQSPKLTTYHVFIARLFALVRWNVTIFFHWDESGR